MFAEDTVFPGEVHWGTRCPMCVLCSAVLMRSYVQDRQAFTVSCIRYEQMGNVCELYIHESDVIREILYREYFQVLGNIYTNMKPYEYLNLKTI